MKRQLVLIKGAGDLGTGVAVRLHRAGFPVVMTDLPAPLVVRRTVAFAEAIPQGAHTVEGITAIRVSSAAECAGVLAAGHIPVLVDPSCRQLAELGPAVVIDAIMAKRNLGTSISDAPVVIALGPGFTAGWDCHAVVETKRGHTLGRAIYEGAAAPDTGCPGELGGVTKERLLRAPACGVFYSQVVLGDQVACRQTVGTIQPGGEPVVAEVAGLLRGLLRDGLPVTAGTKLGDVDPTGECDRLHLVSDKALAIAGGVLEAILRFTP
jgi:xanthine dehydrogenase accessory factor